MPPKKDAKKQAQAKPDNSGIPKRDIEFKFALTIKSQSPEPPSIAVMFEWFGALSDKFQRNETPLLQSWKKQQQKYSFEKDCDLIRVDDDFCKNISKHKFYVYFVNGEDSKVQDQLRLDYSSLLTANSPTEFYFESNIIRALGIDHFSIRITANQPLLEDLYRHYLNPLEVEVIGAKDLPVQKSNRYEPAYVKLTFFDGTQAETPSLVGSDKLLWAHKHVFLTGFMDPVQLKEKMRSRYLKFQLHDRDEVANRKAKPDIELFDIGKAILDELEKEKPVEQDPKKKGAKKEDKKEAKKDPKKDAKKKDTKLAEPVFPEPLEYQRNNYGVAAFSLVEFLKSTTRSARYKAPVVPKNAYEDLESRNLDLNTTARNQMHGKVIASNNYFDCDTVLVVGFHLSHAIGSFKAPEPVQEPIVDDSKKKKDAKQAAPVQKQITQIKEKEGPKDVLERIVFVVPYKDPETIKKIQAIFYSANQRAFDLKSKRQLTTHLLKPEEQQSTTIDYISGIQICDPEGRLYMLQGLREGAMNEYSQKIKRQAPNSKDFKILKNKNIGYSNRLFGCFHLELKRIRFRPNLSQLLLSPSIYIKSKVPEQLSQTLVKLSDARKVPDSLMALDSLNLWPSADALLQLQRKFSQPLSTEDIVGSDQEVKNSKAETTQINKNIRLFEETEARVFTSDSFFKPKQVNIEQNTNTFSPQDTKRRMVMTKTFTKDQFQKPENFTMRGRPAEIPQDQPVYINGGQRLNYYQKQMAQFREKMDPNVVYTYCKDSLRMSIDPRSVEDEGRRQLALSQSKMYSKDKFSSLIVKTKEERMKLAKKPGDQDILDLINYPYHEQQTHTKQIMKNTRDQPTHSGGNQFQKYIRPKQIFSSLPPVEGQKLTPVQQEKLDRERKAREKAEQEAMLKGPQVMAFKKGYFGEHTYGLDRFKDIRDGDAKKLGIIDKHKKDGERRKVQPYEVSYNLMEKTGDPSFNPLVRRDDPSHNMIKDQFNNFQRPEVLTRTQVYKPLKNVI